MQTQVSGVVGPIGRTATPAPTPAPTRVPATPAPTPSTSARPPLPRIVTFVLRRRAGQSYVLWRVENAGHVLLRGKPVPGSGALPVPTGATTLSLMASNKSGSAHKTLRVPRVHAQTPPPPARATSIYTHPAAGPADADPADADPADADPADAGSD